MKKADRFDDYIKLKGFCSTKNTIDKVNREVAEWKQISAMSKPNIGLISNYPRNANKSTGKKKNQQEKQQENGL